MLLVLLAFVGPAQATQLDVNETTIEHTSASNVAEYTGIESLKVSCELEGVVCNPISDVTAGTCRVIEWSTQQGMVRIQSCEKQDKVEVYRQEFPSDIAFSACIGESGCVNQWGGWASFTPTSNDVALTEEETTPEETNDDNSNEQNDKEQNSESPNQDTYAPELAEKYDTLINAWQDEEINHLSINGKELIVVPWYIDDKGEYHTNCGAAGTTNDYCVVTDEDSQYTLAVSMSRDEQLVNAQAQALFNKIQHVSTSTYGHNTRWQFRVTNEDIVLKTDDFASDADARYLLALWNFVNNPVLENEELKEDMRVYAESYCSDYKQHAFIVDEYDGITYWPAGGGDVARVPSLEESSKWWGVTYPGYYGDMSLAMLACGANTQEQEYFRVADDALKAYFAIADYDGSSLALAHGRSGVWTVNEQGEVNYVCQDGCPSHEGTEDADGVRFTSICTVEHYAKQLNLAFTPLASSFCDDLVSSSGFENTAYSVQWSGDGQPVSGLETGWQANGLALYVDVGRTSWADDRINSVWDTQWSGDSFNNAQLLDVFWAGFLVNGLGFNLGYADAAFGLSTSNPEHDSDNKTPTDDSDESSDEDNSTDTPDESTDEETTEQPPSDEPLSIDSLKATCSAGGASCEIIRDHSNGACRELTFSTINGELAIKACLKSDDFVELYLISAPDTNTYNACLGSGCVLESSGFARFILEESTKEEPADEQSPTQEPDKPTIMQLDVQVTPTSQIIVDEQEQSSCRRVTHDTSAGNLDVRICAKEDNVYELYLLSDSNNAQLCISDACVGSNSGFARLVQ